MINFRFFGILSILSMMYYISYLLFFLIDQLIFSLLGFKFNNSISFTLLFSMLWIIVIINLIGFYVWDKKRKDTKNNIKSKSNHQTIPINDDSYIRLPSTSLVIPAFNEEKNIEKVINNTINLVTNTIVINDASTDATASLINKYNLNLINHKQNLGVGGAIKSGYVKSLSLQSEYTIVMAGDDQHSPHDLIPLIYYAKYNNLDYVIGSRLMGNDVYQNMPNFRIFGNFILSYLTSIASNSFNFDSQCGFTAIKTDKISLINLDIISNRWGIPNEIYFEAIRNNLQIGFYPINTIYGNRKSYINIYDFTRRLSKILLKGLFNTTIYIQNPQQNFKIESIIILLSLLLIYFNFALSFLLILILILYSKSRSPSKTISHQK